jgi:hypothetical protein
MRKIEEPNYYIQVSTRKNKKYDIYTKKDNEYKYLLSFGGDPKKYQQYYDRTPLMKYSYLNHLDKERQKRYYQRHGYKKDRNSANYWSGRYLW